MGIETKMIVQASGIGSGVMGRKWEWLMGVKISYESE